MLVLEAECSVCHKTKRLNASRVPYVCTGCLEDLHNHAKQKFVKGIIGDSFSEESVRRLAEAVFELKCEVDKIDIRTL